MELRQIEYFWMLNIKKNFTKAAEELFVTQPTITNSIKNLEAELGAPLFYRNRGNLTLTPAGEVFQSHAKVILHHVKEAAEAISLINPEIKKSLNIGLPFITASDIYDIVLDAYQSAFPNVEINIDDSSNYTILQKVLLEELELGIIAIPGGFDANIETLVIRESAVSVVCPKGHRFCQFDSISLQDLSQENLIMYLKDTTFTERVIRSQFEKNDLPFHVKYRVKHTPTLFKLVSQNQGVSLILCDHPSAINYNPNLILKPLSEPIPLTVTLIWNHNKYLSETARQFIEFMDAYTKQHHELTATPV
jgi:DNA-binding transcriptional LysR family regulator